MSVYLDLSREGFIVFRVVGLTFVEGYPDNVWELQFAIQGAPDQPEPLPAVLIRDPDNAHDPNAIAVHAPAVGRLGSVPAPLAATFAPRLDRGERWIASVVAVFINEDHPERPGVAVMARRAAAPAETGAAA